eukprot:gb/GECG01014974.1/.p1 GENE.gb/GECG01014974.1/~~gb/GECG01014974.1/.p1  ORF type:complete len:630 (+),score=85.98 gb/GECG01014974.1/:1-1890(+)
MASSPPRKDTQDSSSLLEDTEASLEEVSHDHSNTREAQRTLLDESPRGYSTELDVHFAVWDNDIAALSDLLRQDNNVYDLETRDPQGYTPLLLAYALGHTTAAYMLILAGAFPKSRTLEGWESFQLAALSGNPDLVRLAVIAMLKDTDLVYQKRIDTLLNGLKGLPDMKLRMTWEFSSWIPFVSRLLPKDTLTVYKKGSHLRLDSTLLQMQGVTWQRGHLSHLIRGDPTPEIPTPPEKRGECYVMDHEMKTAAESRRNLIDPADVNVQDWVRKLFCNKQKISDWWSGEVEFGRAYDKGWIYGKSKDPKVKEIGKWRNCGVWCMNNLKVTEKAHCPLRKELKVKDWWHPCYSNENYKNSGHDTPEAPEESMSILTGALDSLKFSGGGDANDSPNVDEGGTEDAMTSVAARRTREDRSFMVHFKGRTKGQVLREDHENNNYGVPGSIVVDRCKDVDYEATSSLLHTMAEKYGVTDPIYASNSDYLKDHSSNKAIPTSDEIDKLKKNLREQEHPRRQAATFLDENITEEEKNLDLEVCFSKTFPLRPAQMMPIAEALSRTNKHFQNFERFFHTKLPKDAGFPVQFSIPVFPTITARITFDDCTLKSPDASYFFVPEDYAMGEYVERSFIRQL